MARNIITKQENGLNHKQILFCQEYSKTGDHAEAYRKAGYKAGTQTAAISGGLRLLKRPEIKAYLAKLYEKAEDDSIADMQEVKRRLTEILRQAAEEEVLMTEMVEKGVSETKRYMKKADLRVVTKAAELLAKMAGAFNDGPQNIIGVQVQVMDDLRE